MKNVKIVRAPEELLGEKVDTAYVIYEEIAIAEGTNKPYKHYNIMVFEGEKYVFNFYSSIEYKQTLFSQSVKFIDKEDKRRCPDVAISKQGDTYYILALHNNKIYNFNNMFAD
jgi:hypothetical protein